MFWQSHANLKQILSSLGCYALALDELCNIIDIVHRYALLGENQ